MERNVLITVMIILAAMLLCSCPASATQRCADCGRTPVPYPLSTRLDCGDQLYKVRCNAGTLWFDAQNGSSYMITSINPLLGTMIIRPGSLTGNTCLSTDFHSQGIKLSNTLPFKLSSSNTVLLMNCSDAMLHLRPPMDCSANSICHAYVKNNAAACMKAPLCCTYKTDGLQSAYEVKIYRGGCAAYQSFVNLDVKTAAALKKWPEPGVEIQWTFPPEPICKVPVDCKGLLHSKCVPDPAKLGQRRCLCDAGFKWDPITGLCQNAKCRPGKACKKKKKKKKTAMFAGVAFAGVAIILVIGIGIVLYKRFHVSKKAQKNLIKERKEMLHAKHSGKSARIFTGKEILKAANNFSKDNLIGSGGFGEVFKGILDDGTVTAIKRAKLGCTKGTDQVLNEVRILCQVNHRSLVRLLGCCVELEQPIMIYEYIPNGTLFEHLHCQNSGKWTPLPWQRRLRVAHQTAEGLTYLHSAAVPPIYHRDVKSSNILLDERLNGKVSDFGLSRLVESTETNNSHIFTSAQGTLGYLDPEYYRNFQLTDKSDVYSFGVVLLEILTAKKAIDFNREEENVNLVVYMKQIMEEDRLMDAVDPVLKEGATKLELETIKALGSLAVACLDDKRQNRPTMKEVADEIEYIISITTEKVP